MDFAENQPVIEEVAAKLKEAADKIDEHAENIKKGIEGLHESWVGASYDQFKSQCDAFAPSDVLRAFAYIFENNVSEAASTLEAAVASALG